MRRAARLSLGEKQEVTIMGQLHTTAMTQGRSNGTPEGDGWRAGKPVEDPEKMKRWGFVTAKPSEFLVHVRRGRVLSRSSGQGASCFKWPWDAVSVVPTSLQRLSFRADQVTAEKVGVEVVGLAVYRIAEPLLAYRVLNFSYPERAQQKLEETLTSMFVGAARRLIANLSVSDCLQKRKNAIAAELLREIAPVVGGVGRPDDTTIQGWGVVIDTIEIQEVRVLSENVFRAMQAPFRAQLERQAREAKALADMEVTTREAACERETAEARLSAQEAIRERRQQAARATAEEQAKDVMRAAELAAEQEQRRVAVEHALQDARILAEIQLQERAAQAELARDELKTKNALRRVELELVEAEAQAAAREKKLSAYEARAELERAEATLRGELESGAIQMDLARGRAKAEVDVKMAEADRVRAEAYARQTMADRLPELASAVGQRMGEVKIMQVGGTGNPFESILQAVTAVVEMARSA